MSALTNSPVVLVSVLFQVLFLIFQDRLPSARPKHLSSWLTKAIGVITLVLTAFEVSVIRHLFALGTEWIAVALVLTATLAPVAGLLESRFAENGKAVFNPKRFPGHLTTNLVGSLTTAAFVWAATSAPRFDQFSVTFSDDAAFNIALPMAAAVALAFARSEQGRHAGDVDLGAASDDVVEPAITGYSLRHVHQLLNTIHLTVMIFLTGATLLYLFAQAIQSAKAGSPLLVSWQVLLAVFLTLLFFLACGLPASRGSRTVWMTFVTGTPAAMGFALVWLGLYQGDSMRNIGIVLLVGGTYIAYCVEFILAEKSTSGGVEAHYFSSVAISFALVMLMGAVYIS